MADVGAFNVGDLFDRVAAAVPDRTAIVWGEQKIAYRELRERSDRLAAALARAGFKRGDTVGLLLYNSPAYLEALLATFKLGLIAFNINYRYVGEELHYILDDAQAAGLIHGDEFEDVLAEVLPRLAPLKARMVVERAETPRPPEPGLISYRQALSEAVGDADIASGRSGEDLMLLYTGGTTGMPKGVEWAQGELFFAALGGSGENHPQGPVTDPAQVGERAAAGHPLRMLGCGPLMHGASLYGALVSLLMGSTVILIPTRSFDPELVWDLVAREQANTLSVMGDAMVAPLIDAWDAHPGRWNTSSLFVVASGGAAMSQHLQDELKARLPNVMQLHGMGSSESGVIGTGDARTDGDGFMVMRPKPDLAVIVDGSRVAEVGESGILARTGPLPRGYWRDPKKTAATFVTVGGRRWVLLGDRAKTEPDGSFRLYGRDSTSINTGGEKVFPEEVENALRAHPAVLDAVVVGAPDPRWGQAVVAIASLRDGASLSLEELRDFCSQKLARYKLPRRLIVRPHIQRTAAGKQDVRWAKAVAEASVD